MTARSCDCISPASTPNYHREQADHFIFYHSSHNTVRDPSQFATHSSPPSLSFTIRLGERQGRQENNALKFTESPKVTFSGSGKEPSVLIPSLGFLPELSDAQVKANKAPRPLCLALLPSSLFSFYCSLLPTYNCSLLPPFPVFIHETSIKGYDWWENPSSSSGGTAFWRCHACSPIYILTDKEHRFNLHTIIKKPVHTATSVDTVSPDLLYQDTLLSAMATK